MLPTCKNQKYDTEALKIFYVKTNSKNMQLQNLNNSILTLSFIMPNLKMQFLKSTVHFDTDTEIIFLMQMTFHIGYS